MVNGSNLAIRNWIILIFLGIIWGSSFILMKRALVSMNAVQLASIRIGVACLSFLPYIIFVWRKINWKDCYKYFIVGITTTGIPSFCFAIAQTKVSSATAGILNSLTPIFTLIIGILFFQTKFQFSKLLGVVIGFLGAGLLVITTGKDGESHFWYAMLILLATICYGINTNVVKKYFPNTNSLLVSAGAFVLVGFPGVVYMFFAGDIFGLIQNTNAHPSLWAAVSLSLLCTVLANILFYDLVQKTSPVFGSSVTFLIPLVAIFWGIFDGEQFTSYHIISMVLIIAAIILLRKK